MNDSNPHPDDALDPQSPQYRPCTLCEADGAVLDALIALRAAGLASGPMPPGSAQREKKMRELLAVLDRMPADDPDHAVSPDLDEALVARTLRAVAHHRQRERFAEQVQMVSGPRRGFSFDWRQVISIAALFLIAASLVLPVLERNRAEGNRIACAANLAMAGQAFGAYAQDNAGQMPRHRVDPHDVWWTPASGDHASAPSAAGQPAAASMTGDASPAPNARNLYILVRRGYIAADRLDCPSTAAPATPTSPQGFHDGDQPIAPAEVGYSYQNQYRVNPLRLGDHPDLAILADKNPVFVVRVGRLAYDPDAPVDAPSRVHGRRGQNILLADGRVIWTFRPTITRQDHVEDNVWVPGPDAAAATKAATDHAEPDSFLLP